MPKKLVALGLALTLTLAVGCTAYAPSTNPTEGATTQANEEAPTSGDLELTLEELKAYNGEDGQPAYVAHEGIIYDVSQVPQWKSGRHNGVSAGTDITEAIKDAPHGTANLALGKAIGKVKP